MRKARILRNNLFGIDIDPQAVEITMMSLYLKALEGERSQLPPKHALLPELKYNIVCGNSLIGPDIYKDVQLGFFGEEEKDRINAFDWFSVAAIGARPDSVAAIYDRRGAVAAIYDRRIVEHGAVAAIYDRRIVEHSSTLQPGDVSSPSRRAQLAATAGPPTIPDIMRAGGFDCVIGNPPYVRIQHMKEWAPVEVEYYKEHYKSASSGNYDIYVVFVEKGLTVLNKAGKLGFIVPHKFFNSKYGEPLRSLIAEGKHLSHIVHFGDQQVFEGATNYTCLLFLDKSGSKQFRFEKVADLQAWRHTGQAIAGTIPASKATASEWNFSVGKGAALFDKLRAMPAKLGDIAERIAQGIRTSDNDAYVLDLVSRGAKVVVARSKALERDVKLERHAVSLFLQGREIKRYRIAPSGKVVIIPYESGGDGVRFVPPHEFKERFPRALAYLAENKPRLEGRERGRMRGSNWYAFIYPKNMEVIKAPKILVPDIADRASFALDEKGEYAFTSGYGITLKADVAESPKYVLGLLNSNVLDWYLKRVSTTLRGGFFRYFTQFVEQLPIRTINFSDPADKARHDRMVELVERMLELNKRKARCSGDVSSPKPPGERSSPLQHFGERRAVAASYARRPGERSSPLQLEQIDREIAATDTEIDELVYELYGITDAERRIVEGAL